MNLPKKPPAPEHDNHSAPGHDQVDAEAATVHPPEGRPQGEEGEHSDPICPVCGHPMSEHVIDHTTPNAILECPAPIDHSLEHDSTSPLDELGMPRRPKSL